MASRGGEDGEIVLGVGIIALVVVIAMAYFGLMNWNPFAQLLQWLQQFMGELASSFQEAVGDLGTGSTLSFGGTFDDPNGSSIFGGGVQGSPAQILTGTYLNGLTGGIDQTNTENANPNG